MSQPTSPADREVRATLAAAVDAAARLEHARTADRGLPWERAGAAAQEAAREQVRPLVHAALGPALAGVAERIEAELICCEAFERGDADDAQRRGHAICYWSGAARALVLEHRPG